MSKIVAVAKN
jgi:acylpyruvate hydrolase